MNTPDTAALTRPAARAVLADDERLMREQLRARLTEVWPELDIVAEAKKQAKKEKKNLAGSAHGSVFLERRRGAPGERVAPGKRGA